MNDRDYWFADEQEVRDRYWTGYILPGEVVADIGCHIGSYSIPALKAGATVYAVDPCQPRLDTLRNFWDGDQSRLITINYALAEKGGYTGEFRASLNAAPYQEFHAAPGSLFSTLDDMVAEYDIKRLDWVKIDVEGAELGVLTGGMKTLARFMPVMVIEAHDQVYKFVHDMRSGPRCHQLLRDLGYEIEVVPYAESAPRDFWICKPGFEA